MHQRPPPFFFFSLLLFPSIPPFLTFFPPFFVSSLLSFTFLPHIPFPLIFSSVDSGLFFFFTSLPPPLISLLAYHLFSLSCTSPQFPLFSALQAWSIHTQTDSYRATLVCLIIITISWISLTLNILTTHFILRVTCFMAATPKTLNLHTCHHNNTTSTDLKRQAGSKDSSDWLTTWINQSTDLGNIALP